MRFFWKVYVSIFITVFSSGILLVWASYRFVNHWTKKEYIGRYSSLSKVIGSALGNLDRNTEALMHNAAKIVADIDDKKGILSTEELRKLRDILHVTHIFVIDIDGNFIRSTNEDPKLIPNAFSFCDEYRSLFSGKTKFAATPIVHPNPELKPYKFFFLPTGSRKRLIEIGMRVDFVAQTLTDALAADPNLVSVSMYSPIGEVFGHFTPNGVQFGEGLAAVPENYPQTIQNFDGFQYFMKVPSSHPRCCQCEVAGTTRGGEYYYVLKTEISKHGLKTLQASMNKIYFALIILTLFLALILSHYVSKRLVFNIEEAAKRLKMIMSGGPNKRIHMVGKDEVVFLTHQFDHVLDQLEESQNKLVESEKLKAKVQISREVAHNIKSPTIAIEMILPLLKEVPEKLRKVLSDSATDIRNLTDRLLRQADVDDRQSMALRPSSETIQLKSFLEDLVSRKNLDADGRASYPVHLQMSDDFTKATANADPAELNAVISNLINNARESCTSDSGAVHVVGERTKNRCIVAIKDSGRGIPKDILEKLGTEEISFGKKTGQGIGLRHAFTSAQAWGGHIEIESTVGEGTTVKVVFPRTVD